MRPSSGFRDGRLPNWPEPAAGSLLRPPRCRAQSNLTRPLLHAPRRTTLLSKAGSGLLIAFQHRPRSGDTTPRARSPATRLQPRRPDPSSPLGRPPSLPGSSSPTTTCRHGSPWLVDRMTHDGVSPARQDRRYGAQTRSIAPGNDAAGPDGAAWRVFAVHGPSRKEVLRHKTSPGQGFPKRAVAFAGLRKTSVSSLPDSPDAWGIGMRRR